MPACRRRIEEPPCHKSIITTERYSHLGGNGVKAYYTELPKAMAQSQASRQPLHCEVRILQAFRNEGWQIL